MDCRVYSGARLQWWGGSLGQIGGGYSHESEDLAAMVSEFLENGGSASAGADSWCSSDSDSCFSDLAHLADKISFHKCTAARNESDLQSLVHSLMLSICETDLHPVKSGPCNGSCTKFYLVKLLRLFGYDAAVCGSKWQGSGKVPGGDYDYIDVVNCNNEGSERVIIDIDFRSHFEIARAVESYDKILKLLPVVYVGSLSKLKQLLQIMVEAAKSSLKQNSMPLPPWRSLAYLQAKWLSPNQRQFYPSEQNERGNNVSDHSQCGGHLKRLKRLVQSEMGSEKVLKPINNDKLKLEKRRQSLLWTL